MRWPEIFFKNKPQPEPAGIPRPINRPTRTAALAAAEAAELAEAERALEEKEAQRVKEAAEAAQEVERPAIQIPARMMPHANPLPNPPMTPNLPPVNEVRPVPIVPLAYESSATTLHQVTGTSAESSLPEKSDPQPVSTGIRIAPASSTLAPALRSVVLPSRRLAPLATLSTATAPEPDTPSSTSDAPSPSPNPAEESSSSGLVNPPRRRARLADVARKAVTRPQDEPEVPPAPEEEEPSTIIPPAFPVPSHPPTPQVAVAEEPREEVSPEPAAIGQAEATEPAPISNPADNYSFEEKSQAAASPVEEPLPPQLSPAQADAPSVEAPVPVPAQEIIAPEKPIMERREFLLTNGERVTGRVLSETTDDIYLHTDSIGILTLPRQQIASRLVEVILINGDRIIGDIVADTPESLYVRHASLGTLTIPKSQRSTRVVEVLLKDGDRIVGEVLTEMETFIVIRSAALGTVTVQHKSIEMLNRKVEQIQIKSLPLNLPSGD